MIRVTPPRTLQEFAAIFDNGGRLWDIFSRKGDGVLAAGELARAAGSILDPDASHVHFEFLRGFLPEADRPSALDMLEPRLREVHARLRPTISAPSRLADEIPSGGTTILTGSAVLMKDPRIVGGRAEAQIRDEIVFTAVDGPLYAHHELYELYDAEPGVGRSAVLAVPVQDGRITEPRIHIAGIVRDILPASSRGGPWKRYLLALCMAPA